MKWIFLGSALKKVLELRFQWRKNFLFSRFQQQQHTNFYSGKLTTSSGSFTRPSPVSVLSNQSQNHPLPSTDQPHITPLNPSHGFLPPAPPAGGGLRGMSGNKPSDISNSVSRIQQAPTSIGMHPTFRSDFNVSLRYYLLFCYFMVSHAWISFIYIFCFAIYQFSIL